MILAGIDEAGLGPALGPLCVACAALRTPDGWTPAEPWVALTDAVCRDGGRNETRLRVADSKAVCTGGRLGVLERSVLAFLDASGWPSLPRWRRNAFLLALDAGECLGDFAAAPWFAGADWEVPQDGEEERRSADAERLASALAAAGVAVGSLRARVLTAARLNALYDDGLNKGEMLLCQTGAHLRYLAEAFADEPVFVVVDKQGGRNDYLPFLTHLFPGCWVDTLSQGGDESDYLLRRERENMRIRFVPRADGDAFPVALASMLAKYLRERCMADLNTFFAGHVPDLRPTAGYHGDAPRFLDAVAAVLEELAIERRLLVRAR